jgi:hypothetical protein
VLIYALNVTNQFLIDDSEVAYPGSPPLRAARTGMNLSSSLGLELPGGDDPGSPPAPPPPDIANRLKFAGQAFWLIDTNDAASNVTNLYSACMSFPETTNPAPTLQIARYGTNAVIIKANHFDYSAETDRDFTLLICDRMEAPVWKTIDLAGSSDAQDGWLVQGQVSSWKVADPMFMIVSNLNSAYNAFFRAIPYGGPQVQITGANPFDTVSGTQSLHAVIADLSGTTTTNQQIAVTVNGLQTRWTLGTGNTIALQTTYVDSGVQEVEVAFGTLPVIFDPRDPPLDVRLECDTTATLPLDFENPAFLVNASDMCSPDVGTNYILFGVSQPDQIQATIRAPSDGRLLASYSGYVPAPATIAIPWNFTEADGVTPYTNDTYVVHFVADDPTTIVVTNTIDRQGVRAGGGTIITYTEEDPSTPTGTWLNAAAQQWIGNTLTFLYTDIYDQMGLTQYGPWDVGFGRNTVAGYFANPGSQAGWRPFLQEKLGSSIYSDITIGPAHGNAVSFGGLGPGYISTTATITSRDIKSWASSAATNNWRMRKVAMWSCYSGKNGTLVTNLAYPTFYEAFGIRPKPLQDSTFMRKNAGLFFADSTDQGWFSSSQTAIALAQAEEAFDELWVAGRNPWPGACDPTWAIARIVNDLLIQYPILTNWGPTLAGYYWLPYSGLYDQELMGSDTAHVRIN